MLGLNWIRCVCGIKRPNVPNQPWKRWGTHVVGALRQHGPPWCRIWPWSPTSIGVLRVWGASTLHRCWSWFGPTTAVSLHAPTSLTFLDSSLSHAKAVLRCTERGNSLSALPGTAHRFTKLSTEKKSLKMLLAGDGEIQDDGHESNHHIVNIIYIYIYEDSYVNSSQKHVGIIKTYQNPPPLSGLWYFHSQQLQGLELREYYAAACGHCQAFESPNDFESFPEPWKHTYPRTHKTIMHHFDAQIPETLVM